MKYDILYKSNINQISKDNKHFESVTHHHKRFKDVDAVFNAARSVFSLKSTKSFEDSVEMLAKDGIKRPQEIYDYWMLKYDSEPEILTKEIEGMFLQLCNIYTKKNKPIQWKQVEIHLYQVCKFDSVPKTLSKIYTKLVPKRQKLN